MIALPGPSVLLAVAHSISFGLKHAVFTVVGATMRIAVQLIIAAIGLTSLLNTVAANIRIFLKNQQAFQLIFRATGGLMIIAGIGLALSRRSS